MSGQQQLDGRSAAVDQLADDWESVRFEVRVRIETCFVIYIYINGPRPWGTTKHADEPTGPHSYIELDKLDIIHIYI